MESPLVPRRAAPGPAGPLQGAQPRAPARGGDPCPLGRDILLGCTRQVAQHLPADRRVRTRIKQPLDDGAVLLGAGGVCSCRLGGLVAI